MHRTLSRLGVLLLVARLALDVATPFMPGAFVLHSSGGIEGMDVWAESAPGRESSRGEIHQDAREIMPTRIDAPKAVVPRPTAVSPAHRVAHHRRPPRHADGVASAGSTSDH